MENQNIRNAGLKVTLPRVKILEILESDQAQHMSGGARRSVSRPFTAC